MRQRSKCIEPRRRSQQLRKNSTLRSDDAQKAGYSLGYANLGPLLGAASGQSVAPLTPSRAARDAVDVGTLVYWAVSAVSTVTISVGPASPPFLKDPAGVPGIVISTLSLVLCVGIFRR